VGLDWRTAALAQRVRLLNLAVWHGQLTGASPADGPTLGRPMLAGLVG
jgi:hypothetical protein